MGFGAAVPPRGKKEDMRAQAYKTEPIAVSPHGRMGETLLERIGDTPLLHLENVTAGVRADILAKAAGMDDVFAHGMLVMAYLGQFLTRWRPQSSLRRWSVRFVAITPLHATIHCRGQVVEILEDGAELRLVVPLPKAGTPGSAAEPETEATS